MVTQSVQSGTVDWDGVAEVPAQAEPLRPTIPRNLIRQEPYSPATRQMEFTDSGPIEFIVNGKNGIRLSDALEGNVAGLEGRDDRPLFEGNRAQIIIRLQVSLHSAYIIGPNLFFKPIGCSRWHKKVRFAELSSVLTEPTRTLDQHHGLHRQEPTNSESKVGRTNR